MTHTEGSAVTARGDLERARAFVSAWGLTSSDRQAEDAAHALAQAFASERADAEARASALRAELERATQRLRETIGIVSDISRLMPQIAAALDEYARPPAPVACGASYLSPRGVGVVPCGLPKGHRGPHGVARG